MRGVVRDLFCQEEGGMDSFIRIGQNRQNVYDIWADFNMREYTLDRRFHAIDLYQQTPEMYFPLSAWRCVLPPPRGLTKPL